MTDLLQRFRDCTDPEQRELFTQTADQLGARPEQIEKDLWLCVFLDRVFHRSGALHLSEHGCERTPATVGAMPSRGAKGRFRRP